MSQIIKNLVSGGPVPPEVATSYVTQDGTAVPALNILKVNGFDSIENNDNGIITKGGVAGTGTSNEVDVVVTNRISVSTFTNDISGQTKTVTLMTPLDLSAISFKCSFIGYDGINDEAAGGSQEGVARKSGGTAVIVGFNDSSDQSDPGLATVDWNVIAVGGDLVAEFVGVMGATINWTAVFTYTQTQ